MSLTTVKVSGVAAMVGAGGTTGGAGAVTSVAGRTGDIALTVADVAGAVNAAGAAAAAPVQSVAGRTGAVSLTVSDVSGAVNAAGAAAAAPVQSVAGRTGAVTLTVSDVSGAVNAAGAAAAAPVQSVAGRTGAVSLDADDIEDATAAGRSFLRAVDDAAQRLLLGLGSAATATAGVLGLLLLGSANAAAARGHLELGSAALASTSAFAPASHGHLVADISNATTLGRNLLTAADAAAGRNLLELGSIATQAASNVAITGGALDGVTIGATTPAAAIAATRWLSSAAGTTVQVPYGSGADGVATSYLRFNVRQSGAATASDTAAQQTFGPIKFIVTDAADMPDALTGQAGGGFITSVIVSPPGTVVGPQKQRTAMLTMFAVNNKVGDRGYMPFVAECNVGYGNANQGGVGGWPGNVQPFDAASTTPYYRGSYFGGNDNARLGANATNWTEIIGREISTALVLGSSAFRRISLLLVDNSKSHADADDVGIMFSHNIEDDNPGHKVGIQFGGTTASSGIATTGTLMKLAEKFFGTFAGKPTVARGLDFTEGLFTDYVLASAGVRIEADGEVRSHSLRVGMSDIAAADDAGSYDRLLIRSTTGSGATRLTTTGQSVSATNSLPLPNNSTATYHFVAMAMQVSGSAGTVGDWATWRGHYTIQRGANASLTAVQEIVSESGAALATRTAGVAFVPSGNAAGAANWRLTIGADTTNGGSAISGTGEANKNLKWTFRITSAETNV